MLVVTTMATSNLRSVSWNNADDYESEGELHTRAVKFLDAVNWEALTSLASKLRDGTRCRIEQPYSIGHFNMVRRITFTDDVSWVARLRMPDLDAVFGSREGLDPTSLMRVEVATMKYLSRNTSVPVPEVYHYDFSRDNSIGAPFILMSYIHGNAASELRLQKDCPPRLFGTAEQDKAFRRQMADIQVQLAAIQFDRIGSLYEDGDNFIIGPEPETGDGPWDTAADYYISWVRHIVEVAERDADPEVKKRPSFKLPESFLPLMHQYSTDMTSRGPLRLVNRDFGAHNLLVDDNFNIVGLIDLDGVMAAPIDLVAQFPTLTGLDREVPGHKETKPAAIERIVATRPLLAEYQRLLASSQQQSVPEHESAVRAILADRITSDGATIVYGLTRFAGHQGFVNDKWTNAFERYMGSKAIDSDAAS
ncbi:unnamed protein product [Clonostachys rhizophaga]|uniref:Aminoglycoside phosphotransferase domain-containing protein n=1 Tax=Clonostachys rhizophaga TaxID=160324 RepID=A0A9N9VY39_9HYPO|nr:unnamed protein product [Clonostachys rhizophaga]